ncbi:uncharacterized protein CEXT_525711 [Caerostris extrusa]|uniref:Uncharacterized protein n=1 Tax=Caerostris extrusa TaxID=172846 RepID=A0AAV4MVA3_CAEEX|nr:uncharacterized protein CEXT_525711 [Caerostris extrusa]
MLSQADISVSSLWDLELLGIRDPIEQNSREETEKAVMFHFIEAVRQKEDGRYEVHMPWKVDHNCVTSVQNNAELEIFVESATNVMKEGMFDLRGWESSAISASSESTRSPVLGLIWDKNLDALEIESLEFDEREKITKRKILGNFLAPVMIQPKILLQATWKTKESWEDEVNNEIKKQFLKWIKQQKYFKKYKNSQMVRWDEGIQFKYPYFCRCQQDSLCGMHFLKKLFSSVKQALKLPNIKAYFWTDSSTILTWITSREQWSVFVTNRISEIRKLTTSEDWFHISTDQNPADILSRGCGPKQLQKHKWWQGPAWLKNSKEQWPKSAVNINKKEVETEKRKSVISANNTELESISLQLAKRFSRFSKMIRVMAWILRFQPNAKDLRKCTELKNEELLNAQKIIFRVIQKECYSNEETRKNMKGFLIFEDEEGILRLKSIQRLYPLELTPNYEQVVPETQNVPEVVTEYPELNTDSNETVPCLAQDEK